jgi:hypothetical protein
LGRNAKHTDIKLPELDDDIKVNIEIYKDVLKRKETDLAIFYDTLFQIYLFKKLKQKML